MSRWIPALLVPLSLTLVTTSHALAPGDKERGFREGANHHVGDDSFVDAFGRKPGVGDGEALRMHTHFVHVRRWLSSRDATKPELSERRKEILGYFDEYIAKGTTPQNAHMPWRTPVFIDDHGTICAVGYLIEKTAGRPIAEKIAKEQRYNVLEDIAAAMPEVRAWIDGSGFTIEELASIQPGYTPIMTWDQKDIDAPPGSSPVLEIASDKSSGTFRSEYANGQRLAQGPFKDKKPQGTWRFFHPSGNLAAQGRFENGYRDGEWTFYYDKKELTRMAVGSFSTGSPIDEWRHYDMSGALIAKAHPESPKQFAGAGYVVDGITRKGEIHHWAHQGFVAGTHHRLDFLADGTEKIYVHHGEDVAYDAGGHKLTRVTGGWESSDCDWNRVRKASARSGDLVTLHGLTFSDNGTCSAGARVSAERAKHLDAMLDSLKTDDEATIVAKNMAAASSPPRIEIERATPAANPAVASR